MTVVGVMTHLTRVSGSGKMDPQCRLRQKVKKRLIQSGGRCTGREHAEVSKSISTRDGQLNRQSYTDGTRRNCCSAHMRVKMIWRHEGSRADV